MITDHRPLPASQRHYADPAINDEHQTEFIDAAIDRIHYPTIGCPALITPRDPLHVWLSLPEGEAPGDVCISLLDRHGQAGEHTPPRKGDPRSLGKGPTSRAGKRRTLWQIDLDVSEVPPALYDVAARFPGGQETAPNAARVYAEIRGDEKVVFCGDTQYHVDNVECVERFIEVMNKRDDVAWIALIGDGCDNGVKSKFNMLRLILGAKPGRVMSYYQREFSDLGKRLLPRLNKPIVLVPGNHDGMVAHKDYSEGKPTDVYLGPDPANEVAYDGFHHYRRTIGPLYFAFDWGDTRYLCMNSFELERNDRLGYHAVVANWGGFVRAEQRDWMEAELVDAAAKGKHVVVLMHHDPRGGSEGHSLGYYSDLRVYKYDNLRDIVVDYARYVGSNATTWQQEWMKRPGDPASLEHTRKLLDLLLSHRVHGVIMGHDNENWVESYPPGEDIFSEQRIVQSFAAAAAAPADAPAEDVRRATQLLEAKQIEAAVRALEEAQSKGADPDAILERAFERLEADHAFEPDAPFAPVEVARWKLRAKAPIHFIHVDDVGAYKHSRESHFAKYGFVVARLERGRPISLQRTSVLGETRDAIELDIG